VKFAATIELIACVIVLAASAAFAQATAQRIPSLVGLTPGKDLRLKGARFTESFDPSTYARTDFIERAGDQKPIVFFRHQRSISVSLAHAQRFVLINDYLATKGCRVMIADLDAHRDWQIDQTADQMYQRDASPDERLVTIPEAYEFSPDDKQVLIGMDLVYISVGTAQEANQVGTLYKKWWFSVDTYTGRVLHEYKAADIPTRWYAPATANRE